MKDMKHRKDTLTPELPNFDCPKTPPEKKPYEPDFQDAPAPDAQRIFLILQKTPPYVRRKKKTRNVINWSEDC